MGRSIGRLPGSGRRGKRKNGLLLSTKEPFSNEEVTRGSETKSPQREKMKIGESRGSQGKKREDWETVRRTSGSGRSIQQLENEVVHL